MQGSDGGCSRTNPVTWVGLAGQNLQVQVKREPQHMHMSELVAVKLEQASPGNKPDHHPPTIPASLNNGELFATHASLVDESRLLRIDSIKKKLSGCLALSLLRFAVSNSEEDSDVCVAVILCK